MTHKISGKNQATPLKHLIEYNTQVTNIKNNADTLAETFSANSSSTNSNTEFHKYKDKKAKRIFFKIRTKRNHPKILRYCSWPRWNSLRIS